MNPPLLNLALALGIGLLIGLERERSKGSGPARGAAGIRTFALVAVLGVLAQLLGGPLLLGAVVAIMAALSGIAYWQRRATDPGLTSEVALLLVPLLAALALTQPQLAGGMAVVVAVLLAAKPVLHRFARTWLSADELHNGLVLALATLVVWPLLPDRAMGPYAAINPHLLWLVVILVLAIGAIGHVAVRLIGPRYGLPVSGLASGFVSSVATIGAMGARARSEPTSLVAAVAGGTLSSLATFVQMALVLAAVSLPVLREMAPMLLAGGLVIALYGGWFLWRAARDAAVAVAPAPTGSDAFSIGTALLFAGAMAGILLLTAAAQPLLGNAGVALGAALGGIVDTHAAAMSVAAMAAVGKLAPVATIIPILAAMTANATMKIAMAATSGPVGYTLRVGGGIALSMVVAWGVALVV